MQKSLKKREEVISLYLKKKTSGCLKKFDGPLNFHIRTRAYIRSPVEYPVYGVEINCQTTWTILTMISTFYYGRRCPNIRTSISYRACIFNRYIRIGWWFETSPNSNYSLSYVVVWWRGWSVHLAPIGTISLPISLNTWRWQASETITLL